jgi:hypothetical protein
MQQGGERHNWVLTYEAGSAIGINVHLAAAEELNLSPVTDSRLHHELVLRKLARDLSESQTTLKAEAYVDEIARHAVVKILSEILPNDRLEILSLEDILRFREETTIIRRQFLADIRRSVLSEINLEKPNDSFAAEQNVVNNLLKSSKIYSDEIASTRDRLWPRIIDGFSHKIPAGTAAAGLAASYISGSGYVLAASVLLYALQPLRSVLEWRADLKKVKRSVATSIAYLANVREIGRE